VAEVINTTFQDQKLPTRTSEMFNNHDPCTAEHHYADNFWKLALSN